MDTDTARQPSTSRSPLDRGRIRSGAAIVALLVVSSTPAGPLPQATAADVGSDPEPVEQTATTEFAGIRTSLTPAIHVESGTQKQRERLDLALSRFATAGLPLPDLEVRFAQDERACRGHLGLFEQTGATPWRVTYCSTLDFVYEHELAHAWEAANLTDGQRTAFMRQQGYAVWNDTSTAWADRGIEGLAFVVQQVLARQNAPSEATPEQRRRAAVFAMLTGDLP